MTTYNANITQINQAVRNVQGYRDDIANAKTAITNALEDLKIGWRGASSNAYYSQVVSYLGALDQLIRNFDSVAAGLRSAGAAIVNYDETAEASAQRVNG